MNATQNKERPILFSGPMVRAILEGRKTQTRRVIGKVSSDVTTWQNEGDGNWRPMFPLKGKLLTKSWTHRCPYGHAGDHLWVRETWCQKWDDANNRWFDPPRYLYMADGEEVYHVDDPDRSPWRPSIHMRRQASRIILEVTNVRVQRVQDITNQDAISEGIKDLGGGMGLLENGKGISTSSLRSLFWKLWDSINYKRGFGWKTNPWVWVIEFRKI